MNTYTINDTNYVNTDAYKKFLLNNPASGTLRVKAYAAREAIPIQGLKVEVSTMIENNKVIFYEGYTNASGNSERIILPAPKLSTDNLVAPGKVTYEILATYEPVNFKQIYSINIYDNIFVLQDINVISSNVELGGL